MDDVGDLFDSALNLENQHFEDGRAAGRRDAELKSYQEGLRLGQDKGCGLGRKVGFIAGCMSIWQKDVGDHPDKYSSRQQKAICALAEQLAAFPLSDPADERIDDSLGELEGKFKAIVAMLGQTHVFFPAKETSNLADF